MTKNDKATVSVCEKSMAIMISILKISTISLSHVGVKQLGVHSHGKIRSGNGFDISTSLVRPVHANRKPSIDFSPAYLIEPEEDNKPRPVYVFKPTKNTDVNQRSSEYIQNMRRRILSEETESADLVTRKSMRYPASYQKVVK